MDNTEYLSISECVHSRTLNEDPAHTLYELKRELRQEHETDLELKASVMEIFASMAADYRNHDLDGANILTLFRRKWPNDDGAVTLSVGSSFIRLYRRDYYDQDADVTWHTYMISGVIDVHNHRPTDSYTTPLLRWTDDGYDEEDDPIIPCLNRMQQGFEAIDMTFETFMYRVAEGIGLPGLLANLVDASEQICGGASKTASDVASILDKFHVPNEMVMELSAALAGGVPSLVSYISSLLNHAADAMRGAEEAEEGWITSTSYTVTSFASGMLFGAIESFAALTTAVLAAFGGALAVIGAVANTVISTVVNFVTNVTAVLTGGSYTITTTNSNRCFNFVWNRYVLNENSDLYKFMIGQGFTTATVHSGPIVQLCILDEAHSSVYVEEHLSANYNFRRGMALKTPVSKFDLSDLTTDWYGYEFQEGILRGFKILKGDETYSDYEYASGNPFGPSLFCPKSSPWEGYQWASIHEVCQLFYDPIDLSSLGTLSSWIESGRSESMAAELTSRLATALFIMYIHYETRWLYGHKWLNVGQQSEALRKAIYHTTWTLNEGDYLSLLFSFEGGKHYELARLFANSAAFIAQAFHDQIEDNACWSSKLSWLHDSLLTNISTVCNGLDWLNRFLPSELGSYNTFTAHICRMSFTSIPLTYANMDRYTLAYPNNVPDADKAIIAMGALNYQASEFNNDRPEYLPLFADYQNPYPYCNIFFFMAPAIYSDTVYSANAISLPNLTFAAALNGLILDAYLALGAAIVAAGVVVARVKIKNKAAQKMAQAEAAWYEYQEYDGHDPDEQAKLWKAYKKKRFTYNMLAPLAGQSKIPMNLYDEGTSDSGGVVETVRDMVSGDEEWTLSDIGYTITGSRVAPTPEE